MAINPISLHSAQIWSMGVVLWELLTGQIPFADMNRFHIGFKVKCIKDDKKRLFSRIFWVKFLN